ncbi:MAG TPA: periplasmic heavy metal sensor [Acidobacteriaceae bacterium]
MHTVNPSRQQLHGSSPRATLLALAAAMLVLAAVSSGLAQGRPRPMQAPHAPAPPPSAAQSPAAPPPPGQGTTTPRAQAGDRSQPAPLQIGPAGRWWDDQKVARAVDLKPEQRQRMDSVFNSNKTALYTTYRALKAEERTLDMLQRAESPDEDKILAQIDKVTALRGQLTKSSASLALQLRKELTPEQLQKLQTQK